MKERREVKMCDCGKNPQRDAHVCPYDEELSGGKTTASCNCCEECESKCVGDI